MNEASDYTFSVDLAVVESLGINLYSNAAAVLSELVANAWDADANRIRIGWDTSGGEITIEDDGRGMTKDELNEKYLTVAYKKRDEEGTHSLKFQRPFMGRKGIGKLSVFSLANIVTVLTTCDGENNGFIIRVDDLRESIANKTPYHPQPVPEGSEFPAQGTRIVLEDLSRKRTTVSVTALRRRIARRFDMLSFEPDDEARFQIFIEDSPVTYEDREDLRRLEYIWQLGVDEIQPDQTPNIRKRWVIPDNVVDAGKDWKLEGWFGTVEKPDDLKDTEDTQESLRNIIILARKRPIQEGILDQLDFNKLFGNYVTGQIRAEFLDLDDGSDDIATSDRQRLIEDDERVTLLITALRDYFNRAAQQWSDERPEQKFKDLTDKFPVVREWVDNRPPEQHASAKKMISTVAALELEDEAQRPPLFRASILAFERIAIESSTARLEEFSEGLHASDLLPLLANARSYEDALYLQILRSRLEAIEKLDQLINEDELEKVLQKHLFDNMWLLDPSWEGATGDKDMEIALSRIRKGVLFSKDEEENQKQGRIDIQYRSAAGVHMIVELKRYGRPTSVAELVEQGSKYHQAMAEVLDKLDAPVKEIAVVFVLGQKPSVDYLGKETFEEHVIQQLGHINGRILYYDELLKTAQKQYQDYRDRKADVTELDRVLDALDSELPAQDFPDLT